MWVLVNLSLKVCSLRKHSTSVHRGLIQTLHWTDHIFRVRLIDNMKELGAHSTDLQQTRIQQQANCISHKIDAWIEIQKVYMPKTSLLCARDDDQCAPGVETHPTKIPLYLPSTALWLGAVDPSPNITIINDDEPPSSVDSELADCPCWLQLLSLQQPFSKPIIPHTALPISPYSNHSLHALLSIPSRYAS